MVARINQINDELKYHPKRLIFVGPKEFNYDKVSFERQVNEDGQIEYTRRHIDNNRESISFDVLTREQFYYHIVRLNSMKFKCVEVEA